MIIKFPKMKKINILFQTYFKKKLNLFKDYIFNNKSELCFLLENQFAVKIYLIMKK